MNEIRLFSVKRTIALSMMLALLSILIAGQALTAENVNDNNNAVKTSESQEITSTTNTATQTVTETQTENTMVDVGFGGTQPESQQIVEDSGATFSASDTLTAGENIQTFIKFSLQYVLISVLIFSVIVTFYLIAFNNGELKEYVNQSLSQAGFKTKIGSFGKKWDIGNMGKSFSMSLKGISRLRMKIELPNNISTDPREFGLRRSENLAITVCDLDVLPMRLQVVKLYLKKLEGK